MTQEDFQQHVLKELRDIKETQNAHREDYIRDITRINTERRFEARVSGGVWGIIMAVFAITIKWLADHFSK